MTIVNGYCTLAQLKAELSINDAQDDTKMETAIAAASRQIDGWTGWRFWQDGTVVARAFTPSSSNRLYLLDDAGEGISTTAGLIVKIDAADAGTYGTTLTTGTDFNLEPSNAADRNPVWPYTEIALTGQNYWFNRSAYNRPTIEITAKWGWPAVPDDITKACLIQAAQLFKAKDAVFGAIALGDTSAAMRVRSGLNPMAAALCEPYRRPSIG